MIRPASMIGAADDIGDWRAADEAAGRGDYTLLDAFNLRAKKQAKVGTLGHARVYPGLSLDESKARLRELK